MNSTATRRSTSSATSAAHSVIAPFRPPERNRKILPLDKTGFAKATSERHDQVVELPAGERAS